jgi:phage protein D
MRLPREAVCSVWVQDLELSDNTLRDILNVQITYREKKAADGSMTISDPYFKYFDSKVFVKNHKIAFIIGLVDDAVPMGPFVIKSLLVDAPESGSSTLTVNFQDLTQKLNKKKEKKIYTGKCVDYFKQRATELGIGYNLDVPKELNFDADKALIQANKTKAQIMNSLAERYGFIWGVEGSTLFFRKPVDLDAVGQQKFVPVLSYRMVDYSIFSYRADFKFTREGIKQGAKAKIENLDFENCEEVGDFVADVATGRVDAPAGVLEKLGFKLGTSQQPDEDSSAPDMVKKTVDEAKGIAKAVVTGMLDEAADFTGLSGLVGDGSVPDGAYDMNGDPVGTSIPGTDPTTSIFKGDPADILAKIQTVLSGNSDSNVELGTKDNSGTATPTEKTEAEARLSAMMYKSVVVCDADVVPTISSPRYKPTMSVVLNGLGERLSGKYRITEVAHSFSGESAYTTTLKCQKRYYGASDDDKKKIAAAKKTFDETGSSGASTPGGSDKPLDDYVAADLNAITGSFSERIVKIVNGVSE